MSSSLAPFLYQTRTIQRSIRSASKLQYARLFHAGVRGGTLNKQDRAIPFDWGDGRHGESDDGAGANGSTITPSEAEIFKGIFDEIAQGKVPAEKKRPSPLSSMAQNRAEAASIDDQSGRIARSIVEQARVKDFRDKFLQRYPRSLRNAAQVALGLYEPDSGKPGDNAVLELEEADARNWAEKARYDRARTEERERVFAKMDACKTDADLWKVMEQDVFSLPEKLGVAQASSRDLNKKKRRKGKTTEAALEGPGAGDEGEMRAMDLHGPLYSHYISRALSLLENAFARPSPYVFQLLPRIKELGLPSYVLGVSTPFYSRLARLHWTRHGDANSALEVLHEMISAGLYANRDIQELLASIRNHLHGCNWGAQGEFVMAMMESPPYDAVLEQKLEEMERFATKSIMEREQEYGL